MKGLEPREGVERVEIRYQDMMNDFDDVYYGTLLKFYPSKTIKEYMTVSEYRGLRQKYYRYDK